MEIFDTHAHYDDSAFDADREELLGNKLQKGGVTGVVTAGTTVESSKKAAALAEKYDYIYFAAGIHPEDCEAAQDGDISRVAELIKSSQKAVAVGEIGLDYHWEIERSVQKRWFEQQLELAKELNLPVIIHDREAHADTLEAIKTYRPRGTVHCFSGSAEMAQELIKLGMYLGFTGSVTFKNNKKAAAVIEAVPLSRILVETDCPYMAPEPFRGKRSDSTMIEKVIEYIAQIKNAEPEEIGHITAQNARDLFQIESTATKGRFEK